MKMNKNIFTPVVLILFIGISSYAQEKLWTIEECINYALENNISINQTALDTDFAEQELVNAKGNFLPNLNGSLSQNWNFGSFIGQDGNRVSADSRGNNFSLSTGVTLFNGFRNLNTYKQAQLGVKSSELDLQKIQNYH